MGKKTKCFYYAAQNGRDGPMIYRDWKAVSHLFKFLLSREHSLMAHVDIVECEAAVRFSILVFFVEVTHRGHRFLACQARDSKGFKLCTKQRHSCTHPKGDNVN